MCLSASAFFESRREERPQAPLPTEPPFTAFVGNLSFSVQDTDILELFDGLRVSNVRIKGDRGFGYVEFTTLEDLKQALELNGKQLSDRTLRVDVASSRPPGDRDRGSDRDRDRGRDRDYGRRYDDRDSYGGRGRRDEPREERVLPDDWRNKDDGKDLAPTFHSRVPRDDSRGERRPHGRGFGGDRGGLEHDEAQRERPKVPIQPRSIDAPVSAQANYQKVNPFGAAKPRDENEFMRKKEEEWKKRKEEQSASQSSAPAAESSKPAAPAEQLSKNAEAPKPKKPEEKKKSEQDKPKESQPAQSQKKTPKENETGTKPAKAQQPSFSSSSNQKPVKQPEPVEKAEDESQDAADWKTVSDKKKRDRQGGKAK